MHVKPIIKPPVSETFFYGKIISWKFSDSVTYVKARKKYCFRFEIVFESGKVCPMQRGGFVSKTEAIKARENTIKQLHEKHLCHLNIQPENFLIIGFTII